MKQQNLNCFVPFILLKNVVISFILLFAFSWNMQMETSSNRTISYSLTMLYSTFLRQIPYITKHIWIWISPERITSKKAFIFIKEKSRVRQTKNDLLNQKILNTMFSYDCCCSYLHHLFQILITLFDLAFPDLIILDNDRSF